ncbi:MAG: protein-glutamate O-methyltransferase CheR [Candidatus Methylacidiphilales bacterium]
MILATTLLTLIQERMGLDATSVGLPTVQAAVRASMTALGETDVAAFENRLRTDPTAWDDLVEKLVVPETWFFRDGKPFDLLRALGRTRLDSNEPPLRILSIPCATGEEPYSMVMTLLEAGLTPNQFTIEAADISHLAIERAQRAIYGPNSFRSADLSFRDRYFDPQPDGTFRLKEAIRRLVRFHHANLLDPNFLADHPRFEVIFCRNVLIYFDKAGRQRAAAHFTRLLLPGGLLFVGHAELLPLFAKDFRLLPETSAFAYVFIGGTDPWPAPSPHRNWKPEPTPPRLVSGPVARAIETAPLPPPAPEPSPSWEAMVTEATQLANRGDYSQALALAEACLLRHQVSPELHFLIGSIRLALEDETGASEAFFKTLYLNPKHEEALLHSALLAERRRDLQAAARFRARAARLRSTSVS